jgi:hypothetical protein
LTMPVMESGICSIKEGCTGHGVSLLFFHGILDVVYYQLGLQFFLDWSTALREMLGETSQFGCIRE